MTRTFYLVNGDSMLSEENFLLYEEDGIKGLRMFHYSIFWEKHISMDMNSK